MKKRPKIIEIDGTIDIDALMLVLWSAGLRAYVKDGLLLIL